MPNIKVYQSPMGKVKNNILPYVFIIYTIYRFVKRNFEFFCEIFSFYSMFSQRGGWKAFLPL